MLCKPYIGLLLLMGTLSACQKVITIELPEREDTPVIEAFIEPGAPCQVSITSTIAIFDPEWPTFYDNATVRLQDEWGQSELLYYDTTGIIPLYKSRVMVGKAGRTYTLTVTWNNRVYEAQSKLAASVPIEHYRLQSDTTFLPNTFYVNNNIYTYYTDPDTLGNLYYLKVQRFYDGAALPEVRNYLLKDQLNNGEYVERVAIYNDLHSGDVIQIELRHINPSTFSYLSSLEDALAFNNFTIAAPANPNSNFSNGALGYFGAWGISRQFITVP